MKSPKYIDVHAHVNFSAFDADRDEVIRRALQADTWMINVGTQIDTSRKAVEIAEKYDEGVYAIVGLHPIHSTASYHDKQELGEEGKEFTSRGENFDKDAYRALLKNPKVVGIGECGLDYYRMDPESIENQKKNFISQIELANEVGKPLMLHIRQAYKDAYEILKEHARVRGNVHFFAGTWAEARAFIDLGFTLSFTGVITFARDYDQVIRNAPLEMILSETDCPYVAPVPHRGKRNEPLYVKEVVKRIAEIKDLPEKDVAEALFDNARRVLLV